MPITIGTGRLGWLVALALAACLTLPAAAVAVGTPGTRAEVQKGGVLTAAELRAIQAGRAFPRDHEREGSERNVEKPGPKRPNPQSPRAADGGVVRNVEPAVSLASPLSIEGPNLNDSHSFPPDTQGDVGPTQFIAMINGRVRSYNKATGAADGVLDADTDVFWSSVMTSGGGNFSTDPHIRYDRLSGRWFAVMIDVPGGKGSLENRIMLAVSDGGTITDATNFHFFSIQEGVSNEFADYPTLGIDKNALYIGTNQFKTTGTKGFSNTNVYVVNKASLIAGSPSATRFTHVIGTDNVGPFTPQGVDNDDPNAATGYLIGVDNGTFGQLDLLKISNPGTTPTLSMQTLTVPATAFPLAAANLGGVPIPGGTKLDDLDDRLYAAQMQNGHIFTAHNIGVNASGAAASPPSRDASRWYEIAPETTPALVQSGTVFDNSSSNPRSYWIPTVAVSKQGILALGGSVAGATHMANAWYTARAPGEATGTVGDPTEYTTSSASYSPPFNRWGDYSLTRMDPDDGMTLWTIQEYIASTDVWGTRVAKLRAPAPPAPSGASTLALGLASTALTISGPATDGVGYFEPGAGFPKHLDAAITGCGVTVNSVSDVSPGAVTLDVNSTAVVDGASCDVTITNPDGQSATTNALFTPSGNHAPVANPDGPFELTCCGAFHGTSVLTNDTDLDGNPLTAVKVSDPAHGTLALATDGTFTYTPTAGFTGNDSFSYAASDGQVESAPAAVSLHVAAPAASADTTPPPPTAPGATTVSPVTTATATPSGSADQPALRLVLTFASRARLAAFVRNGLSGRLRCGEACTVKLTLRIPRSVARRLHLRTTIGSVKVTVLGSTAQRVRIRLTRSARTRLRGVKSIALTLSGSARDAAGRTSIAGRKIAVRR